jgi:hypothetical protein
VAPRDQLVPDQLRASKAFGELGVGIAIPDRGFDLIGLLVRGERKCSALLRAAVSGRHGVAVVPARAAARRVPVTIRKKLLGGLRWYAEAAELVERLHELADVRAHAKRLPWAQRTSRGTIALEWVLQLRALGGGTSEGIFQLSSAPITWTCSRRTSTTRSRSCACSSPGSPTPPAGLQGLFWPAPFSDLYRQMLAD